MDHIVCRVFGIFLVTLIYSAFIVEGADVTYGNACVVADDTCTGTGDHACINAQCACATTAYRNNAGDACVAKVALTTTCINGEPADQCTDTLAECRDESGYKCLCKPGNFQNKDTVCDPQVGLDGTCDSTDSATDQCSVTNTACDSTENKCLCTSAFFSDGSACQTKILYGADCSNTVADTTQCVVANQACSLESGTSNYKCQCTTDFYDDGSSACVARKKPDDTGCAADQCVAHATCDLTATPTICECDAGYTATPTTTPTMCSGIVKFASLSYMYVIPILVSLMFLVR